MSAESNATTPPSLLHRLRHHPTDEAAWRQFVDRYGKQIYTWCRRWRLQDADAHDVTQTVLLKLARRMQTFEYDPKQSFRGWLRSVTRNALQDFLAGQGTAPADAATPEARETLNGAESREDLLVRLERDFDLELLEAAKVRVRLRVQSQTWQAYLLTAEQLVPAVEAARQIKMAITAVYKVNHRPLPARTAASLVEALARALHAVHQQGVLHRDLKPGNVLLASRVASAPGAIPPGADATGLADPARLLDEYVPKITDFGLAKELADEPSEWTRTRDVLGTPAYMAPEQAGGARELTPAADVYALGVILYELLTGMPPFRGRDWVELVVQVKELEPVTPSRLLPGIPRDLETICLKCLHKEPHQRYGSAEALADDCRRFLDGRAILARPAGRGEKLAKWCRRNPWVAGLSASLLVLLVVGLTVTTWLFLVAEARRGEAQGALDRLTQEQEHLKQEQGRTRAALAAEKRRRKQAWQALEAITSEIVPDWQGRSPELSAEQRQFLTRALALYQEFARDTAADEVSRVGVAHAQLRVAQFQRNLGQRVEAQQSAEQAEQSWERLVAEFPANREYERSLALAYWLRSVLFRELSDLRQAEQYVRRAAALNRQLLAEGAADAQTEQQLCDCLNTLARSCATAAA